MDSKLVIEQMAGRWKIKHEDMRALAARCRALLPPRPVVWTWVPRARTPPPTSWPTRRSTPPSAGSCGPPASPRRTARPSRRRTGPRSRLAGGAPEPDRRGRGGARAAARAGRRHRLRSPTSAYPTTLLLLRHGRTPLTAAKRFSGSGGADPSLDEEGRRQADAAAAFLGSRADLARGDRLAAAAHPRDRAGRCGSASGCAVEVDDGLQGMRVRRVGRADLPRGPSRLAPGAGRVAARPALGAAGW